MRQFSPAEARSMAKEKTPEEKELGDDEDKPDKEIFLEKEQRDPDEAVFAEQAILHYASDVLDMFNDQVEAAMSEVEAFIMQQTEQKEELNGGFFLESLGASFLDQAMNAFGGADTPIGRALYSDLSGAVDSGVRSNDAQGFLQGLSTALRDGSSYLRDSLQGVLSNEWDELRDLAYEGETLFIPALHAYGLPKIDFDKSELSAPLIDVSQQFLDSLPKQKEQNVEQEQIAEFEEQEAKMEEPEVQNLVMEEEEKKEAII
jgi:hypothetical protein